MKRMVLLSGLLAILLIVQGCSLKNPFKKEIVETAETTTALTFNSELNYVPMTTTPEHIYTIPPETVSTVSLTDVIVPSEEYSILPEAYKYISVEECNVTGDQAEKRIALFVAANIKGANFTVENVTKTVSEVDTLNQVLRQKLGLFLEMQSGINSDYLKERLKQGFLPIVKLYNSNNYALVYGYTVVNGDTRFNMFRVVDSLQRMEYTYTSGISEVVYYLNVVKDIKDDKMYDFFYWDVTLQMAKERSQDDTKFTAMWGVNSQAPIYKMGDKWYAQVPEKAYEILKEGSKTTETTIKK